MAANILRWQYSIKCMTLSRRSFIGSAFAAPALLAQPRRTNVVFIMTDDHGPWATSATGCPEMHTPAIASLAKGGMTFDKAFACTPVCSPSRITWMTGEIPSRHGVQDWLQPVDSFGPRSRRFLDGHLTWSETLARNGYTLGLAGKWHMGHDDRPHAGFSYWATIPGGGGPYQDPVFFKNGETTPMKGFKTDLVGDCAIEFLDRQKDSRQPFALYLPFYAPHTPFNYQPDVYRAPYASSKFDCFPRGAKHPWQNPGLANNHNNEESMRAYSALVAGADANIARVLDKLKQIGADGDTTVIFTADQGWSAGHHGVWGKGNGTIPFNMYDSAIGVPLIWCHPGRIRPGARNATMVSSYDFFPTLIDWLGLSPATSDAKTSTPQAGLSYASLLRGRKSLPHRDALFFEYCGVRAIRTNDWKYVAREDGRDELYHIAADPDEKDNLASSPSHAAQRRSLARQLDRWFTARRAPALKDWRTTTTQDLQVYKQP